MCSVVSFAVSAIIFPFISQIGTTERILACLYCVIISCSPFSFSINVSIGIYAFSGFLTLFNFSILLDISRLVSFIAFVVLYCHNSAGFCSPLQYTFECGIAFSKVSTILYQSSSQCRISLLLYLCSTTISQWRLV